MMKKIMILFSVILISIYANAMEKKQLKDVRYSSHKISSEQIRLYVEGLKKQKKERQERKKNIIHLYQGINLALCLLAKNLTQGLKNADDSSLEPSRKLFSKLKEQISEKSCLGMYCLPLMFSCSSLIAKPPALPNFNYADNVCWNNSALQLLRNIRPFTDFLINDKNKGKKDREYYGKGDQFIDDYIDFLEASLGMDQKKITEAIEKVYKGICPEDERGKFGYTDDTIKKIFKTFPDRVAEFLSVEENLKFKNEVLYHDAFFSSLTIERWPDYLVIAIDIPKFYVNDPYRNKKIYPFDADYEIIGYIDSIPGVHFWAFIKDQFNGSTWYKCNDSSITETSNIVLKHPVYALFKKIKIEDQEEVYEKKKPKKL